MNWYLIFIDILLIALVVVMARHLLLRMKYFLHIFQQNGYKFNEYRQWLLDHWNRRVITPEHIFYNLVIFLMLYFMSTAVTGSAAIIILALFGFFWFGPFGYYRGEKPKKSLVFTPRVIRLSIPFLIFCLALPAYSTASAFKGNLLFTHLQINKLIYLADIYILSFGLVLGDVLIPFWIFSAGWITAPVEKRIHRHFIKKAKRKLAQMPDLKIIAITGSYGKTSTKFMIRDLLQERFSVCSTPGSYNTPMGICKVINNNLGARHQVLILEMGARYEGNIDELCDIAEPDIAVIINVGIAHLETFGSQEAIARTKSTLVKRLKPGGTAVLNADDPLVSRMGELRDDITVVRAGIEQGSIRADNITYDHTGTSLTVKSDESEEPFHLKLLGKHNVENMLLAVGVASTLGIRLKTMSIAASRVEPVEHRLQLKKEGELFVIDDAFNSNPVGAENAVDILARFDTGRRIIVTPGMIELGEVQEEKNYEFGRHIGAAGLDLVILIGKKQTEPIRQGIKSTGFDMAKVEVKDSLFEANDLIRNYAKAGDVILYENDLPDTYNE